jgi:radical SAM superfamily enzyme YgiQ (UPF0313 family)
MVNEKMTAEPTHPLLRYEPRNRRRILCVFPKYAKSFGTFDHAYPLMGDVKGFMPPQGILVIASLLPERWEVRFIDENTSQATDEDFQWADAVFCSGMHIQREDIHHILRRARAFGKLSALGGPSVSSAPEWYPDADLLHCGEVGDATLRLFQRIDEHVGRPESQIVYRTVDRLPMEDMPSPDYARLDIMDYLLGSVQFSSGCPFTCEFCDIPALYGRNPRLKKPEQIIAELDLLADGGTPSVYFVDDNFVGNPHAARELLPHLIEWQKKRDGSVRLSCEATLNITKYPDILEMMRQAFFTNIFVGIETPQKEALAAMKKRQNLRAPILDSVKTLNDYGMEVASGIIMGLDTDNDDTADAIIDFARESRIPIMTVNLLYALPKTPLYDRLEKAQRLNDDPTRESNVEFLRPYDVVVEDWLKVIRAIYSPEFLYRRYAYQSEHTYANRIKPAQPWKQATPANLRRAGIILKRLVHRVGIQSDYRKEFWKMFGRQLGQGNIETIFQVAMVAHHLITYGRECTEGRMQASNYSAKRKEKELAESAIGF